jgi:hypothetical protein
MARIAQTTIPGGANGNTSGAIDTTGGLSIIRSIGYQAGSSATRSDSKGNVYVDLTAHSSANIVSRISYCVGTPTVGSGHTFTNGGSSSFSSGGVAVYDEALDYDTPNQNGASSAGANSLAPGSITPSVDNCWVIAAQAGADSAAGGTIAGGFTKVNGLAFGGGVNYSSALHELKQTTATAANPTMSQNAFDEMSTSIAAFKPSGAAATKAPPFLPGGYRPRFTSPRRRYV